MSAISTSGFQSGFLGIDVGSSRVKLGWFPPAEDCTSAPSPLLTQPSLFPIAAPKLPQPVETLAVSHRGGSDIQSEIRDWVEGLSATESPCFVASVHPGAAEVVQAIIEGDMQVLTAADLPLEVRV